MWFQPVSDMICPNPESKRTGRYSQRLSSVRMKQKRRAVFTECASEGPEMGSHGDQFPRFPQLPELFFQDFLNQEGQQMNWLSHICAVSGMVFLIK